MPGKGLVLERTLVGDAQEVVDRLRRENLSLVTAESCTAGLIAAALAHGRGAGRCLHGGFIAYSKENKARSLGVSPEALTREGSVSREVAIQMATGALERSPADIALAVTGVLGPDPDEDGRPPGLVWFGLRHRDEEPYAVPEQFLEPDPDAVRRAVLLKAFGLLLRSVRH